MSEREEQDDGDTNRIYFYSYDDINVHMTMLKDTSRMMAFKEFMSSNIDLFKDQIVVDVGSGTGILSLFAAYYGAKHVYAVEASQLMSQLSKQVVESNGYSDRITVLDGPVESVTLPGDILADVLISEWMGFYLLHESMLDSVITARDHLLKPGGAIFPSTATLYACPVSLKEFCHETFDFWNDVYGFNMSAVARASRNNCLLQPQITLLPSSALLSDAQPVCSFDLQYVDVNDFNKVTTSLEFIIKRNDLLHGLGLWFDVGFDGTRPVTLDTSPSAVSTHWKQTVVVLPDTLLVNKLSQFECRLTLEQLTDNKRRYNITVEISDEASETNSEHSERDELDDTETMDTSLKETIINTMHK